MHADIFQLLNLKHGIVPPVEKFSELQLSDIMHHPGLHDLPAELLAATEFHRHQAGQVAHHNSMIHRVREIVFYAFFILQRRLQPLIHSSYHNKRLTSIYPDIPRRAAPFSPQPSCVKGERFRPAGLPGCACRSLLCERLYKPYLASAPFRAHSSVPNCSRKLCFLAIISSILSI